VVTITKRIAVVGLYNSGSTALAGMLHRMGVNMGAPFWTNSEEDHPENFYESWDLSIQIRSWWTEPLIVETAAASERIKFLKNWASAQQFVRPCPLGAKHPMLSLSVNDLLEAWGANTCIIRACGVRPAWVLTLRAATIRPWPLWIGMARERRSISARATSRCNQTATRWNSGGSRCCPCRNPGPESVFHPRSANASRTSRIDVPDFAEIIAE